MASNPADTFREMAEELQRLRAENVRLALEVGRLTVAPVVAREREGENIGALLDFRMRTP